MDGLLLAELAGEVCRFNIKVSIELDDPPARGPSRALEDRFRLGLWMDFSWVVFKLKSLFSLKAAAFDLTQELALWTPLFDLLFLDHIFVPDVQLVQILFKGFFLKPMLSGMTHEVFFNGVIFMEVQQVLFNCFQVSSRLEGTARTFEQAGSVSKAEKQIKTYLLIRDLSGDALIINLPNIAMGALI